MFEKELNYFIKNQERLVEQYQNKVLIIKGEHVVGVSDTPLQAYLQASAQYQPGTFMIQPCLPGPDAYTVTVTFASL